MVLDPSYDQGQVCSAALDFALLPNLPYPASRTVCFDLAADILEYTARDLRSPAGAFFSAEDADSAESFDDLRHTKGALDPQGKCSPADNCSQREPSTSGQRTSSMRYWRRTTHRSLRCFLASSRAVMSIQRMMPRAN